MISPYLSPHKPPSLADLLYSLSDIKQNQKLGLRRRISAGRHTLSPPFSLLLALLSSRL